MHQFSGNKGEFVLLFGLFLAWGVLGKSYKSLEDELKPKLVQTNAFTEIQTGTKELSKWNIA